MTNTDARLDVLEKEIAQCRDIGNQNSQQIASMERDSIERLTRLEVQGLNTSTLLQTFVSQHQFAPVRLIAYGLAGGVLVTVLGAVLAKTLGI